MKTSFLSGDFTRTFFGALCSLILAWQGHSQIVTNTSGGRFLRGSGTNEDYMSVVIPLSFQKGVPFPLMDYQVVGTNYFPWNTTNGVLYHYNATNMADQSGLSGRIPFNQPIAAFGSRAGGSALYFNQPYEFGIYAGQALDY